MHHLRYHQAFYILEDSLVIFMDIKNFKILILKTPTKNEKEKEGKWRQGGRIFISVKFKNDLPDKSHCTIIITSECFGYCHN